MEANNYGILKIFAAGGKCSSHPLVKRICNIGSDSNADITLLRQNVERYHCQLVINKDGLVSISGNVQSKPIQINGEYVHHKMYLLPDDEFSIMGKRFKYENPTLNVNVVNRAKSLNSEMLEKLKRLTSVSTLSKSIEPTKSLKEYPVRRRSVSAEAKLGVSKIPKLLKEQSGVSQCLTTPGTPKPSKFNAAGFTVKTPQSAVKPSLRSATIMKNATNLVHSDSEFENSPKPSTSNDAELEERRELCKTPVADKENMESDSEVSTPLNNTSIVVVDDVDVDEIPMRSTKSRSKDISIQRLIQHDESFQGINSPKSTTKKSFGTAPKCNLQQSFESEVIGDSDTSAAASKQSKTNAGFISSDESSSSLVEADEASQQQGSFNVEVKGEIIVPSTSPLGVDFQVDSLTPIKTSVAEDVLDSAEKAFHSKTPCCSTPGPASSAKNLETTFSDDHDDNLEQAEENQGESKEARNPDSVRVSIERKRRSVLDHDCSDKKRMKTLTPGQVDTLKSFGSQDFLDENQQEATAPMNSAINEAIFSEKQCRVTRRAMTEPKLTKPVSRRPSLNSMPTLVKEFNSLHFTVNNSSVGTMDTSSFVYVKNNIAFEDVNFPAVEHTSDVEASDTLEDVDRELGTPEHSSNLSGIKEMMATPTENRANAQDLEEDGLDVSGVLPIADEEDFFPKKKFLRTYGKSMPASSSVQICNKVARKTDVFSVDSNPDVQAWLEESAKIGKDNAEGSLFTDSASLDTETQAIAMNRNKLDSSCHNSIVGNSNNECDDSALGESNEMSQHAVNRNLRRGDKQLSQSFTVNKETKHKRKHRRQTIHNLLTEAEDNKTAKEGEDSLIAADEYTSQDDNNLALSIEETPVKVQTVPELEKMESLRRSSRKSLGTILSITEDSSPDAIVDCHIEATQEEPDDITTTTKFELNFHVLEKYSDVATSELSSEHSLNTTTKTPRVKKISEKPVAVIAKQEDFDEYTDLNTESVESPGIESANKSASVSKTSITHDDCIAAVEEKHSDSLQEDAEQEADLRSTEKGTTMSSPEITTKSKSGRSSLMNKSSESHSSRKSSRLSLKPRKTIAEDLKTPPHKQDSPKVDKIRTSRYKKYSEVDTPTLSTRHDTIDDEHLPIIISSNRKSVKPQVDENRNNENIRVNETQVNEERVPRTRQVSYSLRRPNKSDDKELSEGESSLLKQTDKPKDAEETNDLKLDSRKSGRKSLLSEEENKDDSIEDLIDLNTPVLREASLSTGVENLVEITSEKKETRMLRVTIQRFNDDNSVDQLLQEIDTGKRISQTSKLDDQLDGSNTEASLTTHSDLNLQLSETSSAADSDNQRNARKSIKDNTPDHSAEERKLLNTGSKRKHLEQEVQESNVNIDDNASIDQKEDNEDFLEKATLVSETKKTISTQDAPKEASKSVEKPAKMSPQRKEDIQEDSKPQTRSKRTRKQKDIDDTVELKVEPATKRPRRKQLEDSSNIVITQPITRNRARKEIIADETESASMKTPTINATEGNMKHEATPGSSSQISTRSKRTTPHIETETRPATRSTRSRRADAKLEIPEVKEIAELAPKSKRTRRGPTTGEKSPEVIMDDKPMEGRKRSKRNAEKAENEPEKPPVKAKRARKGEVKIKDDDEQKNKEKPDDVEESHMEPPQAIVKPTEKPVTRSTRSALKAKQLEKHTEDITPEIKVTEPRATRSKRTAQKNIVNEGKVELVEKSNDHVTPNSPKKNLTRGRKKKLNMESEKSVENPESSQRITRNTRAAQKNKNADIQNESAKKTAAGNQQLETTEDKSSSANDGKSTDSKSNQAHDQESPNTKEVKVNNARSRKAKVEYITAIPEDTEMIMEKETITRTRKVKGNAAVTTINVKKVHFDNVSLTPMPRKGRRRIPSEDEINAVIEENVVRKSARSRK